MTRWWRRGTTDEELAEEIRQHIDELVDELVADGMSRDEAMRVARRRFGNATSIAERSRDVWSRALVEDAWSDLRYAARQLRRAPSFAAAAILTLAIGIGATSAIFSVAYAALLNPLPFPEPDRLVTVNEIVPLIAPNQPIRLTAADMVDYQQRNRTFDALGGWTLRTYELSGDRESERVQGARVTASFFGVLRVPPALGRAFTADEDNEGVKVCVISDGLWRRRFGADPGVLGRTVYLERVAYKIVGVMPRTFEFPLRGGLSTRSAALWVPMSLTPEERETRADNWDYNGIGRLKPGVTAAQASADVNAIAQHIVNDLLPADREGFVKFTALAQAMAPQVSGNVRPLVLALAGAVACVLLIACVNVANLLLARGAHRRREMAVRAALGAGRFRLLRQLVTETLLFAGIGAAAGGLLAWWSTRMLTTAIPARFAVLGLARFNWPVLAFTAALSVGAAILAGIVPGLAASGAARMNGINERGSSPGAGHRRLRSTLVVAEIALALVLLVGAGLLARTFRDLLRADPGFQPEGAIGAYVSLPEAAYPDTPRERQIYRDLLERLHAFPHVEFAATGTALPLNGTRSQRAFWPDQYVPPPGAGFNIAAMTTVSPEYLQAIGATLLRGRYFTRDDDAGASPVAVVTEALARQYWPGQDPIGKRLKWGIKESPAPWLTVVGVVADVKQQSLDAPGAVQVFVPADQVESSISESLRAEFTNRQLRAMYLVVRGRGGLDRLAGELRDTVRALDPQLAVTGLAPLTDAITASAAPQRFNMLLMAGFAAIAVLLAVVGLYGLIAYSVAQRTREIGIRMAMGAMAGGVVRMIVRDGMVLAASGVAIGTAAAAALAPALGTLLFGVKPLDPATFAGVAALLLAVSAVATWVPARRATRIDPTRALRAE